MSNIWNGPLKKIDDWRWLIPRDYKKGMLTDGLIFANERMIDEIRKDQAPEQVANVACLPGIVGYARHPLGIWFPHWWGGSHRGEGGSYIPGGSGF